MIFKISKPCKGDQYEAVPALDMKLDLADAEEKLAKAGFDVLANVQRFVLAKSPDGITFNLFPNGRVEFKTSDEMMANEQAKKLYTALEDS